MNSHMYMWLCLVSGHKILWRTPPGTSKWGSNAEDVLNGENTPISRGRNRSPGIFTIGTQASTTKKMNMNGLSAVKFNSLLKLLTSVRITAGCCTNHTS